MQRRRVAWGMLACVVGGLLLPSQSQASAKPPTLTITASGTASVIVRTHGKLPAASARQNIPVQTAGAFAGFLIRDMHGNPLWGQMWFRDIDNIAGETEPLWSAPRDLAPGRYLVTVIADKASTLRIPLESGPGQSVAAHSRAYAFARFAAPRLPDLSPVGTAHIAVPAGEYALAVLMRFARGSAMQAEVGDECITSMPSCATGGGARDHQLALGSTSADGTSETFAYSPATVAAGVDAVFEGVAVAASSAHSGFVLLVR